MTDLTKPTVAAVAAVMIIEKHTLPVKAGVTIEAGHLIGIDSNGQVVLADADAATAIPAKGVALTSSAKTGGVCTFLTKGLVDVGNVLGDLAMLAPVYASGTAGRMSDAAVGDLLPIGEVVPAWGATSVDKLLRLDIGILSIIVHPEGV